MGLGPASSLRANTLTYVLSVSTGRPVFLEAGEPVAIQLEYYENGGDAVCELYWSGPGIEEQIIPASFLSPTMPASVIVVAVM